MGMSKTENDPPVAARRQYDALRAEVERHSALYYVEARSEISDVEFDALLRDLQELEARYPALAAADSPTRPSVCPMTIANQRTSGRAA